MPMEQLSHGATEAEINGAPGISELQFEGHDLSELYFIGVSWLRDTVYGTQEKGTIKEELILGWNHEDTAQKQSTHLIFQERRVI